MPRRNSRPRPKRAKLIPLKELRDEAPDRSAIAKPRPRPEAAR